LSDQSTGILDMRLQCENVKLDGQKHKTAVVTLVVYINTDLTKRQMNTTSNGDRI